MLNFAKSFGGTVEKDIPTDVVWIDDAFYIKETRFGLFTSILKNPLGQHFITGAYQGGCRNYVSMALCVFKMIVLMNIPVS